KAALGAKPADKKIEDQEYFILDNNPWLDMVGQSTFAMMLQANPLTLPVRSGPRLLRVYDEQTLVFADPKPMELFLSKKGVFDRKSPDAAPSAGETAKGKDTEEGGGPGNMQGMRGKMGGMGRQGGGGPPAGMMMGGGAGGNLMQGGQPKPEEPAAGPSGAYLTLGNTGLKTMLDRVEAKHPVISLALDTDAAKNGRVQVLGINLLNMKTIFEEAMIIGAALQFKDGITFTVGAGYQKEDDQAKHLKSIQK